eukprot:SAG22_NODE_318_length_12494_cov_18.507705_2_plen_215_part_00
MTKRSAPPAPPPPLAAGSTTYLKNFTERDVRDVDLAHGSGITYRHFAGPVLWPFGTGLSYTTFSYKWSDNNAAAAGQAAPMVLSTQHEQTMHEVAVTNTGTIKGDCVVLAFVTATNFQGSNRDEAGAPLRRLFGFKRLVDMLPNEKRTALFSSTAEDLSVVDTNGDRWLKPRAAGLEIGDVVAPARRRLTIEGAPRLLDRAGPWAEGLGLGVRE